MRIDSPSRAHALGIATVFPDLALCENLDVVRNPFLGREIGGSRSSTRSRSYERVTWESS